MTQSPRSRWPEIGVIAVACLIVIGPSSNAASIEHYFNSTVTVINMTPEDRGGESHQDSEPNLAVNPQNPLHIAASAFTPNPMEDKKSAMLTHIRRSRSFRILAEDEFPPPYLDPGEEVKAPLYVSTDGGLTWDLRPVIGHGNSRSGTSDITLAFGDRGGVLYAAQLEGVREEVVSPCPFGLLTPEDQVFKKAQVCLPKYAPLMVFQRKRDLASLDLLESAVPGRLFADQPYVEVVTVPGPAGTDVDRVFIGSNDLGLTVDFRTATIDRSLDGNASPGALYNRFVIDPSSPVPSNGAAVRAAAHPSGTVYGVFYHLTGSSGRFDQDKPFSFTTDVVVVRDDDWARGERPFAALRDPQRGTVGTVVAASRKLPVRIPRVPEPVGPPCTGPAPDMGQERLGASNISIAVDPADGNRVVLAWADSNLGETDAYRLHVKLSVDGGLTWSRDLLTIEKAKNPALAVNDLGVLGFLYQEFNSSDRRWVTHFRRSENGESWSDVVLANVEADSPGCIGFPYIGDYVDVQAVGSDFFGVFSANNDPIPGNFPSGVIYQRYVHFDGTLRRSGLDPVVEPSIDPFFFKVIDRRLKAVNTGASSQN